MDVKILGSGCPNCNRLEQATVEVLKEHGVTFTVDHVRDFKDIMNYGVMHTPALVVDGAVKVAGRIPGKPELEKLLGLA